MPLRTKTDTWFDQKLQLISAPVNLDVHYHATSPPPKWLGVLHVKKKKKKKEKKEKEKGKKKKKKKGKKEKKKGKKKK